MNMGMQSAWSGHDNARMLLRLDKKTKVLRSMLVMMMTMLMLLL
jgi:hypothetical protein